MASRLSQSYSDRPVRLSPGFSIRESTDIDHYRAQPGNWSVEVNQLAKGSFGSRVRSLELPGLIAYHNQWKCPAQIQGDSPSGWLMIGGIVDAEKAGVTWCGQPKDRRRFAATGDNQEIHFSVENQASNVVLLIEPDTLESTVGAEAVEHLRSTKHLNFGASGSRLIDAVLEALARCEEQPQLLDRPAIVSRTKSTLLRDVEACFLEMDLSVAEQSVYERGEMVHRAILHVQESEVATSAWEMARTVGVSQKTLELAFREVMDTTPGKYLMLTRLNGAHHALARADRANATVTDIALGFGFTHMGRFAKAYRQLFDELPSETLERPEAG